MLGLGKKIALTVGTTMIPTLKGGSFARGGRGVRILVGDIQIKQNPLQKGKGVS